MSKQIQRQAAPRSGKTWDRFVVAPCCDLWQPAAPFGVKASNYSNDYFMEITVRVFKIRRKADGAKAVGTPHVAKP